MITAYAMSPEDRLLFTLTRQTFSAPHQEQVKTICRTHPIRWDIVLAIAKGHGVAPLVYTNVRQCNPPDLGLSPAIEDRFRRSLAANTVIKEKTTQKLIELLSFFNRHAIDLMLVKGAALDILVYDQPWYTVLNDVDLVVRAGRDDLSAHLIAEIRQQCRGFPAECDFQEHHDLTMNQTLPLNFQRIWADAMPIKFRGQRVFVMSPEDLLIAACINSCRKRYFRLKALCDIATILKRFEDLNWERLINKARDYDCQVIVFTALLTTEHTVGCRLPPALLDDLAVGRLKSRLIRYLGRHMSWSSLLTLYSGPKLFGRRVSTSLILPGLTYRGYQLGRKIRYACRKRAPIIEPDILDLVKA